MVSTLAFFFDNPSSNPESFFCKILPEMIEIEQKDTWTGPFKKVDPWQT